MSINVTTEINAKMFNDFLSDTSKNALEGYTTTERYGKRLRKGFRFVKYPIANGKHHVDALYYQRVYDDDTAVGMPFNTCANMELCCIVVDGKDIYYYIHDISDFCSENQKVLSKDEIETEMTKVLANYLVSTTPITKEDAESNYYNKTAYITASNCYALGAERKSLEEEIKADWYLDDSVIIDYLSNPDGWAARTMDIMDTWSKKETNRLGREPRSYRDGDGREHVVIESLTNMYLAEMENDVSCWEHVFKDMCKAIAGIKNVHVNIEVPNPEDASKTEKTDFQYPADKIPNYMTLSECRLDTDVIQSKAVKYGVEIFLARFAQDREHCYDIPMTLVRNISSRGKVIWENPFWGKDEIKLKFSK